MPTTGLPKLSRWLGKFSSQQTSPELSVNLDRPYDRLITGRVQLLAGWLDLSDVDWLLSARCGDRDILLRPFDHPLSLHNANVRGFYGYLFLQDHLDAVRQGSLQITFLWEGQPVARVPFHISPLAVELASKFPLNRNVYSVPERPGYFGDAVPHTLVFPGLGAVGGSSVNEQFRMLMYRTGRDFPVYSEGSDSRFWNTFCLARQPDVRWIDGHGCYAAGEVLQWPSARITFLREPICRMASVYNYNTLVHPYEFPFSTIEEFVQSDQVSRYSQCFGLLRCAGVEPIPENEPQALYTLASNELIENYQFVGITELFAESVFCICAMAGYSDIGMAWPVLASPRRVSVDNISARTRRALEQKLAADCRMYEDQKSALESLLYQLNFGAELQEYLADASAQRELPEIYKMMECLHWRLTLADERFRSDR